MKQKLISLSRHYRVALARHLKRGPASNMRSAHVLGRQAVALGLETLEVARIHAQALATLILPNKSAASRERVIKLAKSFFAETIIPIEKTHRAAVEAGVQERQLNQTLRQRTMESSRSARQLKQGIVRREAAEAALKKSGKQTTRLLEESRGLQKHSQHLARKILSVQEDDWRKLSHQLHDEVAQILLGINVRLLALKRAAKANTGSLRKEIASTQRLVKQSVKTINRFAHEFGLHHET